MTLRQKLKQNPFTFAVGWVTLERVRAARRYFRQLKYRSLRAKQTESYLQNASSPKLQIGCGYHILPGWLNTDFEKHPDAVFLDATKRFPFPDETFEYVFSEHMIEHITFEQGHFMLVECYRVMKPGGVVRIATPNLAKFAELYSHEITPACQRYIDWALEFNNFPRRPAARCFVVNNCLNGFGHRFVYDVETLKAALEDAGFREVSVFVPRESAHEPLRNLERHGAQVGDENNLFETMVLEALR
jgi:predicted SAM-dependent methyltransferase